ncbi:MAG: GNVR domain-containing protein [Candidatus Ratteibacteria bacterium]|jgi:tyrosine-protein kinase Etk/Wzc
MEKKNPVATQSTRSNRKILHNVKIHALYLFLTYIALVTVGVLAYLMMPKHYKAMTTILKPLDTTDTIAIVRGKSTSETADSSSELFMSILKSRSVYDGLIDRFELKKVYRRQNRDRVREILQEKMTIASDNPRVIRISVVDQDPERAAEMANYVWFSLDRLLQELTVTAAKKNRIFIDERVRSTSALLNSLYEELNRLQSANKLLAIKDTGEISQLASQLMTKLTDKKLELDRLLRIYQPEQPEIKSLRAEIRDLQGELDRLTSYQKALSQVLREIKTQDTVYSYLTSQLEEAKISESKNTPFVQVLDKAVPPEKVFQPNIKLILAVITSVMVGVGVLTLLFDILKFLGSI